jgi:hypothetical protein
MACSTVITGASWAAGARSRGPAVAACPGLISLVPGAAGGRADRPVRRDHRGPGPLPGIRARHLPRFAEAPPQHDHREPPRDDVHNGRLALVQPPDHDRRRQRPRQHQRHRPAWHEGTGQRPGVRCQHGSYGKQQQRHPIEAVVLELRRRDRDDREPPQADAYRRQDRPATPDDGDRAVQQRHHDNEVSDPAPEERGHHNQHQHRDDTDHLDRCRSLAQLLAQEVDPFPDHLHGLPGSVVRRHVAPSCSSLYSALPAVYGGTQSDTSLGNGRFRGRAGLVGHRRH